MSIDTKTVSCGKCKIPLDEDSNIESKDRKPCPKCGSTSRTFHVSIHESITFRDKLGMRARHGGQGKPFLETVSGDDLHRKSGKWMKLERTIDRENDEYHEIVIDPSTEEIVHECKEPLSEHKGHGAAKFKKGNS